MKKGENTQHNHHLQQRSYSDEVDSRAVGDSSPRNELRRGEAEADDDQAEERRKRKRERSCTPLTPPPLSDTREKVNIGRANRKIKN